MPYTPLKRRPSGNQEVKSVCIETKGDLAAVAFDFGLRFINQDEVPSFDRIQDAISGLDAAIDELKYIKKYYELQVEQLNGTFRMKNDILDKIDKKFEAT